MLPKGATAMIHFLLMGRCKEFWDNPTEFIPERFLNREEKNAFMPFGLGARNCELIKHRVFLFAQIFVSQALVRSLRCLKSKAFYLTL
jgi:hypothetical protein